MPLLTRSAILCLFFLCLPVSTSWLMGQDVVEYPSSLQPTRNFQVEWCRQDSDIRFRLTATGNGWVAIGFNDVQQMIDSDVIMATGEGVIQDSFAEFYGPPTPDAANDATLLTSSQAGGVTTVEFSRPLVTGDTEGDYALDAERYMVWAMNASNDSLRSRHSDRGFTASTINFSEAASCIVTSSFDPDFNGDEVLDVSDVNLLLGEVRQGTNTPAFDVNDDALVDTADITAYIHTEFQSYIGDANLDGEFNTSDLVAVFSLGEYEDSELLNSQWQSGDWNGDGEFGTGDLVFAFSDGGFEVGPRAATAVATVPEPTAHVLALLAATALGRCRRRR